MLTAVQACLDSSPYFPRFDTLAFARIRNDEQVELLVPDALDDHEAQSFIVDLRTSDSWGPMHPGVCIPPPPELGFVDITVLLRRVEDSGSD